MVLTSTHNLCFGEKNVYPCKPQFYYIKVGCKGVFVTRTCFHDGEYGVNGGRTRPKSTHVCMEDMEDFLFCREKLVIANVCDFLIHVDVH